MLDVLRTVVRRVEGFPGFAQTKTANARITLMVRFVTAEEIAGAALPVRPIYDLVVEGFTLCGRGEAECPPKAGIHTRPGAFTHAMPAYLPTKDIAGSKIISVYPGNDAIGVPSTNGIIIMSDAETGIPSTVLDASWITSMRTAMVSMVDVAHLANPQPTFGIVGATGVTGRAHIEAIAAIYPGSRILVGSREPERLKALFADTASTDVTLVTTHSNEEIVRGSDVVIVCTSHLPEPILSPEWLHPGHNVLNVHSRGWPCDVLSAVDLVSCDDRRPITDPVSGLLGCYPDLDPDVELGQVVVGAHVGRETSEQVVFSFNYGLAVFDILVADHVLRSLEPRD